ncbi:hypothetical protein KIM67_12045 [Flagellimonas sp. 389]|uniref:hypothetical protein n=1 Tax=Flagellimonas sp. 389 TaxID=2835862 RepID=UPI001BD2B4F1|nr:hypothetical protein [Flagellimonas sp. 389]MBS9463144.1 hypothetical protein [Flagellimonas sp. 389]
MKYILALIIFFSISCCAEGQEKDKDNPKTFDTTYRLIGVYGDSTKFRPRKKSYQSYLVMNQDTILLSIQDYKYFDSKKDTVIQKHKKIEKELDISTLTFIVNYSGEFFLIKKSEKEYDFLDKIGIEYKTFYDKFGEGHETYFPAGIIENIKKDEYIVVYYSEGGYKVGIFEITEDGIKRKFLSKGCLFYEDWYEWHSFYEIKNGRIFLNYLIDPNRDEIGQVELIYENGEYSLHLNQCE